VGYEFFLSDQKKKKKKTHDSTTPLGDVRSGSPRGCRWPMRLPWLIKPRSLNNLAAHRPSHALLAASYRAVLKPVDEGGPRLRRPSSELEIIAA
jgi:hypothetical protein